AGRSHPTHPARGAADGPGGAPAACFFIRRLEGRLGFFIRRLEGRLGFFIRRLEGRLGAGAESRRTPMTTDVTKTVANLRDTFDAGQTRPAGWRKAQLRRLEQLLTDGEDEIGKAMRGDLGKAPAEGWVT